MLLYGGYGYGYGYGMHFDPTYIMVIIGAVICMAASAGVKSTFAKYSKVMSRTGMTGADMAMRIKSLCGLGITVGHVSGSLTDHYDPRTKRVNLSDSVLESRSVAALAVAAHECGHAVQDQRSYIPLRLRHAIVPVANIGSSAAWPLIIAGLFINSSTGNLLITIGIWAFSLSVAFQIVTLPVEFNASRRALAILSDNGLMDSEELGMAKKVLTAAALTYVASAAASILQLLRLVILFGGRDRD